MCFCHSLKQNKEVFKIIPMMKTANNNGPKTEPLDAPKVVTKIQITYVVVFISHQLEKQN